MEDSVKCVRVSVVVPAYNAASFLRPTLASLASLRPPAEEVIVVDDGSNDDTLALAADLLRDLGIEGRVVRQRNQGVSAARNRGIAEAQGDYVLFLDADDWVAPVLTERVRAAIGSGDARAPDVVCWRFQHVNQDGTPLPTFDSSFADGLPRDSTGRQTLARVLRDETQAICTLSAAYRRDFLRNHDLGFTEGCATGEDSEFIWKALAVAERVVWVDEVLSYYVNRAGSVNTTAHVRRLDGVLAYQRVSAFLRGIPGEETAELAEIVDRRIIPRYMLALSVLVGAKAAHRNTVQSIEDRHPGLTEGMRRRIHEATRRGHDVPFAWRLLAFSPRLCIWYLKGRSSVGRVIRSATALRVRK